MKLIEHKTKTLLITFTLVFLIACTVSQKGGTGSVVTNSTLIKTDTSKRASADSGKVNPVKPYNEIITDKAITRRGLFAIHTINGKYFFEISDSLLDKEILLISRIAQGAVSVRANGFLGYAGDQIGESIIAFSKGPNNKIFIQLHSFSYDERSADSSQNGMYRSVQASTLKPIMAAFDVKAIRPDSSGYVIEVTDFLASDNPLLYLDADGKKMFGFGGYQKDKSYIQSVQAFPLNVEVEVVNTYLKGDLPVSLALNASFVQLPNNPMSSRRYDSRVGYFNRRYFDYDAPGGGEIASLVTRWRLEPKDEDKNRYLQGELVEPKKPIVYYIDPATPKKWVPYLIQGVNDWQKAFEKAGFKNAIYALQAPANDSTFSLFDARHSAIIYKASPIPNASGPHIHDPRTGEILETHINWYHNVQQLVHDWYMVQASPNDCGAQKMVFDDELMGELIRFVCAHEVGHTLGLRHNFAASSSVPTDSLRNKNYLDKNGFCPSIMDYARFNYVAQPEDGLTRNELMPRIGAYDEWAIEWGYRWLPEFRTKEEEAAYMNQWISSSLKKDKRLLWVEAEMSQFNIVIDPRVQAEDLGDDAIKSTAYGIKNLKRVMENLNRWAVQPNKGYQDLDIMYKEVLNQYSRYMMHVANNIGNKYWTEKKAGQEGAVVTFIPRDHQKKAVRFLADNLFNNVDWLYNKQIFSLIGGYGDYAVFPVQKKVIDWLVTFNNYSTMSFAKMQQPNDAYSFDDFLTDFETEIWSELSSGKQITFIRRNLQKLYAERLIFYGVPNGKSTAETEKFWYDFYPVIRKHMNAIINQINRALPGYKDEASRMHLLEVKTRLMQGLNASRFGFLSTNGSAPSPQRNSIFDNWVIKEEQIQIPFLNAGNLKNDKATSTGTTNYRCNYLLNLLSNQKN